jgi:RNA polymerase sigma factor (TIGR02999 family)
MPSATPSVTLLLQAWNAGDPAALERLTALVYRELHRLAAEFMRRERGGHTLSATDLVSEAFLRLAGDQSCAWKDRVHFFAVAARQMRHILVDHARRRAADKRGAGAQPLELLDELVSNGRPADILALDEALGALAEHDARKARCVELHYFAGLGHKDIGLVLEVHVNTVARELRMAEAWLARFIEGS